ncbi:TPA: hypothetical protein DIC20_02615 [Candidatus Dependentiae bacterium]|nr:MAG: hypothetical protein US03_C0017G0004 [candidate division TM6 bacterium GW2011_GWF2_36_131]KKQ02360.1 MAG: hypothetical protein US13_C0017G0004 [candidate division TM6 bacterium GW2011_GWE2_36_25]HBR70983.1 hypothetical protein [Candidatus Dependentiae bacterium]HCU00572.1 hypothetical protein [Candidatus Dependentiae bacterium]
MKILRLFFLTLTISSLFAGLDEDLIDAAKNGDIKSVTELLDRSANIHAWRDRTLRKATKNGHTEVVKLLLDCKANIHADHDAPLRWAAKNGHTDTVRLLLDRGANIHARDDHALRLAALYGHTDTARLLLDRGANIHALDDHALRWAAEYGHTDTARLLLDHNADLHARDWSGSDASLKWAAENGHTEVVRLLVDRGADIHAECKMSERKDAPLIFAAGCGRNRIAAMLELCGLRGFEEFRADPLAFIEDQKNAERPVPAQLLLLWSIILNREEAFDLLLNISLKTEDYADDKMEVEESYDIANTMDKHRMTALMYAALVGDEYMWAKLVHAGAKINLKNEWGKTAIQLAADAGHWNTASYLLMQLKGKRY